MEGAVGVLLSLKVNDLRNIICVISIHKIMPLLEEIQLNRFQLSRLMSKNQLELFDQILAHNVFCIKCGTCEKGIQIKNIVLDNRDDLQVTGECNICGGEVCRIIEFEEDADFKQRAAKFRKSLQGNQSP